VSTGAAYGPASTTELQRLYVAARLQQAYGWTCAASAEVPAVAQQVAPALTIAAQLYEARQYPAALGQLASVVVGQTRWAYQAPPGR
jgi:hypothetical protein